MLTQQLLDQLEARWRASDAPIVGWLQPGLSDEAMDELTAPLGIRLPEEARRWWRWHDGVPMDAPDGSHSIGAAGPNYIPLSTAVQETTELKALMDDQWNADWLVMTAERDPLVLDCGVPFDQPVRVHLLAVEEPRPWQEGLGADSIGELVSLWIEAIDNGAYVYNKDAGHWERHPDRLTPRMRGRGLV